MLVTLKPYRQPGSAPVMPPLVKMYMDGQFAAQCDGHTVVVETDSQNTGHGMTYLNRLLVRKGDEVIYDTGMMEWRTGLPGHNDSPKNRFINPGMKRVGDDLLLGVMLGTQEVCIYTVTDRLGPQKERFDVGKAEKSAETGAVEIVDIAALQKIAAHPAWVNRLR